MNEFGLEFPLVEIEAGDMICDRRIEFCGLILIKLELFDPLGLCRIPCRRILARSASQALDRSNKDVEADLFKDSLVLIGKFTVFSKL